MRRRLIMIQQNNEWIDLLYQRIEEDQSKYEIFDNEFYLTMARVSCNTLKNVNYIVEEYLNTVSNDQTRGEKILLVFGLLQGLFVAIDSLYALGRSTKLNKLLININQNAMLKEIKRIRNDIVGHPSYRFYHNQFVGYCSLDIDHITAAHITYHCYYHNPKLVSNEKTVDVVEVIKQYYRESNKILEGTSLFLKQKISSISITLSSLVVQLFQEYQRGVKNDVMVEQIKNEFASIMQLNISDGNRILWRMNNIQKMFQYDTNKKSEVSVNNILNIDHIYIPYLICSEMKKVYLLLYGLEKQINPGLKMAQLSYPKLPEMQLLKKKLSHFPNDIFEVLKDINHDFHKQTFLNMLSETSLKNEKGNQKLANLIRWIKQLIQNDDKILLYAIASELQPK